MSNENYAEIFDKNCLDNLLPIERSNDFFDALFGDASEGAYDIRLHFADSSSNSLQFELHLVQRPGKCLACNLTFGLPEVFSRHPVINLAGVAHSACELADVPTDSMQWKLGTTQSPSSQLHKIPFTITY